MGLIATHVFAVYIVKEGLVTHFVAAGCGVVAGKIPVAGIGWAGFVQVFDALIYNVYRSCYFRWSYKLRYFIGNLLRCKWLVYFFYNVNGM